MYYLNGDLLNLRYPGSNFPNYEFTTTENAAGRVTTGADVNNNVFSYASYTPNGQLANAWVGPGGTYGGNTISNTYNNRLQPVQLLASTGTVPPVPILNLTYNFNLGNGTTGTDNGNVIQITNGKNATRTQNFTYDTLSRIQSAYTNGPNWGENYTTDPWGNLTNIGSYTGKTGHENLNCASANTNNQLNTCFMYDAAGNVIKNGSTTYTYDDENRLIATGGFSYIYDGDGQRIEKCTMGATVGTCASNATGTFYWKTPDGSTLAESDLGGNWTAAYGLIRGQIASRTDIAGNVDTNVRYYFRDHLGSTSIVTDGLGNIQNESDYYPYGGEIVISDSDPNHYKFTGKERDTESNLDYFGSRHYASSMGRFMTPDWAAKATTVPYANFGNPQSLNLYSYVENNPLTLIDDNGHDIIYAAGLQNAQLVKDSVQAILANPHTSANLSGYVGPNSPDLTIQSGDLSKGDTVTKNPDGTVTTTTVQGNTAPDIQTSTSTSNGVTSAPETILTGATITIDDRTSKSDTPGVLVHESVHAGEAQADPAKFSTDAAAEKSLPHDQRPQEQRAIGAQQAYGNEIKKEVKQIEKDRKKIGKKDDSQ